MPVPPHFRKTLQLAQSYVGKDALTQDELLSIAAIDFAAPAVQVYLTSAFPEPPPRPVGSGSGNAMTAADHAQRCAWTRDTFLLCAQPQTWRRAGAGLAARVSRPELIKKI